MKSSVSTSSAFSAGFLPSPEPFNQSASSSCVGFSLNQGQYLTSTNHHKIAESPNEPSGIVALAAASINSSFMVSKHSFKEKSNVDKEKAKIQPTDMSCSLTNVANLMPVKITVQSDAGSITSYDNLNKSKQTINEPIEQDETKKTDETVTRSATSKADKSESSVCDSIDTVSSGKSAMVASNSLPINSGTKPGSEVLILIATWIKNAPNDFMDTRVIDEVKHFFNQLDSLKSSFKPWTSKLKQELNLEVGFGFNFRYSLFYEYLFKKRIISGNGYVQK